MNLIFHIQAKRTREELQKKIKETFGFESEVKLYILPGGMHELDADSL